MKKLLNIIYGAAFILIFGAALCADGIADLPHGFVILFAIVAVAGALVFLGNHIEYGKENRNASTRIPRSYRP